LRIFAEQRLDRLVVGGAAGRCDFDGRHGLHFPGSVVACHPKANGEENNESRNAPHCACGGSRRAADRAGTAGLADPDRCASSCRSRPGQAADIFARLMAERLTEIWKQQVVVDNKGGGGGIPGVEAGRAAAPDGYTFLIATSGTFGVNPSLYADLPYKPLVDFKPITNIIKGPADHRRPSDFPGEHGGRADRARAQGAGQALLRLGRPGYGAASQHGAV
jgi:hypothetical protein